MNKYNFITYMSLFLTFFIVCCIGIVFYSNDDENNSVKITASLLGK